MGKRWYGSISNRIEENKMYCKTIEIGTPVTRYYWSDREPYEVVAIVNQKHLFLRKMDAIACGEPMSNTWQIVSNPTNQTIEVMRRYKKWYQVLHKNGKLEFSELALSFGRAEKYFDYEF